jgi:hypothetical protein
MQIATITAAGASSSASWAGGFAVLTTSGTFDGARYKWQYSPDAGSTWIDVFPPNPPVVFDGTSDTETVYIPAGLVRVFLYDVGGSTSITVNAEPTGFSNPAIAGIVAGGNHTWAGGAAATDSISVDGLDADDIVIVNIHTRGSGSPTSVIGVNDAANDQIDLVMDENGEDDVTKISYVVLRPVS